MDYTLFYFFLYASTYCTFLCSLDILLKPEVFIVKIVSCWTGSSIIIRRWVGRRRVAVPIIKEPLASHYTTFWSIISYILQRQHGITCSKKVEFSWPVHFLQLADAKGFNYISCTVLQCGLMGSPWTRFEHRTGGLEARTLTIDHHTFLLDHHTFFLDHHTFLLDHQTFTRQHHLHNFNHFYHCYVVLYIAVFTGWPFKPSGLWIVNRFCN